MLNRILFYWILTCSAIFGKVEPLNFLKVENLTLETRIQDNTDSNHFDLILFKNNLSKGISYLINNLDNEQIIHKPVVKGWKKVYIGDMALIALCQLFSEPGLKTSSIPGLTFQTFLKTTNIKNVHGETLLRQYLQKNTRVKIKSRWSKLWERYINKLYWNEVKKHVAIKPGTGSFPMLKEETSFVGTILKFKVLGYEEVYSRFWVVLEDTSDKGLAKVGNMVKKIYHRFNSQFKLDKKEWKITFVPYDYVAGYGYYTDEEFIGEYHFRPWMEEHRVVFFPSVKSKTFWIVP